MTIYLFDGTMDGLLTAVITGSVPLITGAVPLIIFDPYSTFVPLRKKRPSVLPVGATQRQLLLRKSVSHYVLLYQDFAPSKDSHVINGTAP